MRVLIFSDTFLPKIDGIGISIQQFCEVLEKQGFEFLICAPTYKKNNFTQMSANIHVMRFRNVPLPSYPEIKIVMPSRKRFRKAIKSFEPDLIHIHSPGLMGQYGIALAKLYNLPMVGTYHTLVNEMGMYLNPYRLLKMDKLVKRFRQEKKLKKSLPKLERKKKKKLSNKVIFKVANNLYERCDAIVSPSELIRTELKGAKVKTKVITISNGLDLKKFKGKPHKLKQTGKKGAYKILHVGRLSFEKNVDVVLRAFSEILKKLPNATLDIVGDGPAMPSLSAEAHDLDIRDRVRFTGFIPRGQLPEIYPEYDMFITASAMETQGLVALEAAACGLPLVGVDAYALPEIIQDGKNGYVVTPFDAKALSEASVKLLGDPAAYEKMSKHSLKVASGHDLKVCAEKLAGLYRELVPQKATKAKAKPGKKKKKKPEQ